MNISDEAVEAAIAAMETVTVTPPPGVSKSDWLKKHGRYALLAGAIEAAAPFIAAQAWDEGAQANSEYELEYRVKFDYGDDLPEPPTNPYRSEERKTTFLRMDEPNPQWKELT